MEKQYKISESQLLELLETSVTMQMLDRDGVDNWSWFGESFHEIVREYFPDAYPDEDEDEDAEFPEYDFKDCARSLLSNYEAIE